MTIRVFTCHDCGHKMRFFGKHCGKCYAQKLPHQLPSLWLTGAAIALILLIMVLVSLLT